MGFRNHRHRTLIRTAGTTARLHYPVSLSPCNNHDFPTTDHLAPVYAQWPIDVVDAEGVHLRTRDGRRVLDLYGGHAVAALGYSHPRWQAVLEKQARSLLFQSNAVPLEVRSRAAARLARFAGQGLNTVFFVSTGAEANENALKLALKITGRRKVVAIEGSFHGRTARQAP